MNASHGRPDDERDAWLSAALRHAPDAKVGPPAALSDTILRQARAAARDARAPRSALAAAWDWLTRPPVAAGFASLMVATLVGLIWWDRPMDETLVRPPAEAATPATRDTHERVVPPATASSEAGVRQAPAATSERALAAPKSERSRAPRAQPQSSASAAPAAPAPFSDIRARAPIAPADAGAAEPRDEATAVASGALARPAAKAAAAAPAAAAQLRREDSAAAARPAALAALLESIAAQPERWSWQRGHARQPMTPALQGWLLQLDRATTGRWQNDAAAPAGATPLQLYRDGVPVATLHLGDDTIWLAPVSQAALPRAALAALKQALDDATR
ncbi:MAG TPA: hypothetical protein VNU48_05035 [Burkholderiaceae bacterium]|nr:hypothetical protein [Burkholderiaceae bacterium]